MKNFIIILLGIIVALLIVGGAVAYTSGIITTDDNGDVDVDTSEVKEVVKETVNKDLSSDSSSSSDESDDSDILSEEVKFNAQEGSGYYREVTYKDGGFRQYDTESGNLIGSSYESDQGSLPSME